MISDWTPEQTLANRTVWADALASGAFLQGRNALVLPEGKRERWCCLGVASEAAAAAGVIPKRRFRSRYFAGETMLLPLEVQEWLGLAGCHAPLRKPIRVGSRGPRPYCPDLMSVNDEGMPFWKIASLIRDDLLKLVHDFDLQDTTGTALRAD